MSLEKTESRGTKMMTLILDDIISGLPFNTQCETLPSQQDWILSSVGYQSMGSHILVIGIARMRVVLPYKSSPIDQTKSNERARVISNYDLHASFVPSFANLLGKALLAFVSPFFHFRFSRLYWVFPSVHFVCLFCKHSTWESFCFPPTGIQTWLKI